MNLAVHSMGVWAFRSLARSQRVRFATAVGFVFHLLSTFMLIRLGERRDIAGFVYLTGFIPVAILATVTQGNLFGVDRGATLTTFATPVAGKTFSRLRLFVALLWTLASLLVGWIVGVTVIGPPFIPVLLLQLAFAFLLCSVAGILSVYVPSSRAYARTTGQTMSVTTLVPLNLVSLVAIAGAIRMISPVDEVGTRTILAAVCAVATLLLSVAAFVFIGNLFESRKESIMDALKENP
jgi:uncharacterized protein YneF (UPF0154 family)